MSSLWCILVEHTEQVIIGSLNGVITDTHSGVTFSYAFVKSTTSPQHYVVSRVFDTVDVCDVLKFDMEKL